MSPQKLAVCTEPESAGHSAASQRVPRLVLTRDDDMAVAKQTELTARVLVVEDDFLVATEVELALSDAGLEVIGVAASADEAIQLARLHKPALAVMDIRISGQRDGIQAALELFRELGLRSIFATAHYDQASLDRAKEANPLGWLHKPYSMSSLVKAVRQGLLDLEGAP